MSLLDIIETINTIDTDAVRVRPYKNIITRRCNSVFIR